MDEATYDAITGTAGGRAFGAAVAELARAKDLDAAGLAAAAQLPAALVAQIVAGESRAGIAVLAALARAVRVRAIEFMQKTQLLSLEVYAGGLDPLFFLPAGQTRHDARIYMREINPRHAVPEGDMLRRNPVLKALLDDTLLDAQGKLEVEFTYLLRAAVRAMDGVR
jgi:transcriptional regulator with XRE-family HTH domain